MTADRWTRTVRQQLALGRSLPLGGPGDGAWIADGVARAVLRAAAGAVPGVRPGRLRIALADPGHTYDPAVPQPPAALPPGPLRVTADFAATAAEPLPATAERLRTALLTAATRRLGLTVAEIDLRATDLLDDASEDAPGAPDQEPSPEPPDPVDPVDPDERLVADAALTVPGVARLTGTLGGVDRAVHFEPGARTGDASLPRRHVRLELAVRADHRAVDVARAVRTRVGDCLPDHPSVAVLVTSVS
jgi:hypothetical protein